MTLDTMIKNQPFLNDVLVGLALPQKAIPPRWLYDERGSTLFEQITLLDEYYVSRAEQRILSTSLSEIAKHIGKHASLIEYGVGAAEKIRYVLDALDTPEEFIAIDISYVHMKAALDVLQADYPDLTIKPIEADFINDVIEAEFAGKGAQVGFFPGSTIGNLSDDEINAFLIRARTFLGSNGQFILGADLAKSPDVLIPAYDDAKGVTAAFNKNLIRRMNRELYGTLKEENFIHSARWNENESRIEMHLESLCDQTFTIDDQHFAMKQGETIHTENSRKFKLDMLDSIAKRSGWKIVETKMDEKNYFAVLLLEAV